VDRKISFRGRFLSQASQPLTVSVIATFSGGLSVLGLLEVAAEVEAHEGKLGAQIGESCAYDNGPVRRLAKLALTTTWAFDVC
jgi:hypothetical protein